MMFRSTQHGQTVGGKQRGEGVGGAEFEAGGRVRGPGYGRGAFGEEGEAGAGGGVEEGGGRGGVTAVNRCTG